MERSRFGPSTRVWRRLEQEHPEEQPPGRAPAASVHLALALWLHDGGPFLTDAEREWLVERMKLTPEGWTALSREEWRPYRVPFLAWLKQTHPELLAMVVANVKA